MLGTIFRKAQNKIRDLAKLKGPVADLAASYLISVSRRPRSVNTGMSTTRGAAQLRSGTSDM